MRACVRSRIVLVVTHGFGGGVGFFYRNLRQLAAVPWLKVFAFDWPGMGRSSRLPFSADDVDGAERYFIEALEQWRISMGLERFVLLGHSLGGYLSAIYALRYPARVMRLILVSPVGIPRADGTEGHASRLARRSPLLVRLIRWIWESGITPQSLIRLSGPLGAALFGVFFTWRFGQLPAEERRALFTYAYQITAARSSSERALYAILSFVRCAGCGGA